MPHWIAKFRYAIQGIAHALRSHSSFAVHVPVAAVVIALAVWLRLEPWRWAALLICIGMVLALELINTAIEMLVHVLHPGRDPRIGRVLDFAAAAVLVAAVTAAIVGLIVLLPPLWEKVQP